MENTMTSQDIREIILRKNITIKEAARQLYLTERTMHNLLNGSTITPQRRDQIKKWAESSI